MSILLIAFAVVVAVVNHGHSGLFVISLVNALLAFWGNGVMANYSHAEAQAIPNYAATLSIITTLGSVLLLILHFVV